MDSGNLNRVFDDLTKQTEKLTNELKLCQDKKKIKDIETELNYLQQLNKPLYKTILHYRFIGKK